MADDGAGLDMAHGGAGDQASAQGRAKKPRETRAQKIARLEARLKREKSLQNKGDRKTRTGQLVAFGIYLEILIKNRPDQREILRKGFLRFLTDPRNLNRALAGLDRCIAEADAEKEKARKAAEKKNKIGEN